MLIETLSVFPEMFEPVMSTSILGRARKAGLFDFKAYNLRDWTHDRHRTVDDEPYGGGQGMLMKVEPIAEAIEAISSEGPKPTVVFFTPCGEPFTQHVAERLLKSERLLFVCSRYEGVDERAYAYADERLSIGDYVLTGGELPAMVVADAVVRLIPGALGDEMSNVDESFSTAEDGGLLEYAQYTRPAEFNGEGGAAGRKSEDVDGWNVGIVKPEGHYTENAYVLTVKNHAVATSGDYRNFYYDGGRKFSHTISPQTGYPVENGLASVTVFHDDCMTADALATALTAMGEKEALAFAEENGLAVILFVRDGSGIVPQFSSETKKMTGEK